MLSFLSLASLVTFWPQPVASGEELSLSAEELSEFTHQINPVPTVEYLSGLGSRLPGAEGCRRAEEFIAGRFREFGLETKLESFSLAMPVDKGATLKLEGAKHLTELRCLWPNFVRTSKLPAAGLSGPLLYARSGDLQDFNGKPVEGSVVLMDFNCATRWLNAGMLGARAIVFIEPEQTAFRAEATQKFLLLPAPIPRFWIGRTELVALARHILGTQSPRNDSECLESLLKIGQKGKPAPTVSLQSNMEWENVTTRNIVATLPGTDPALSRQTIVLEAYYDSISVVPTLAPGADAACGIASLLEMARFFARQPPRRTVQFLATSGHFQALAGIRQWTAQHVYLQKEKGSELLEYFLGKEDKKNPAKSVPGKIQTLRETVKKLKEGKKESTEHLSQESLDFLEEFRTLIGDLHLESDLISEVEELYDLEKELKQGQASKDRGRVSAVSSRLEELYEGLYPVFQSRANRESPESLPTLFVGLDLSSRGQQMGLFYKGHFYDQFGPVNEFRLQRQLAQTSDKILEFAEAVKKLELEMPAQLVSGVVPKRGRDWRSYMPDPIALDGEAPLLAAIPSLSFVTTNDSRALVDTPDDDMDNFDPENLLSQARLLFPLLYEIFNHPGLPLEVKLEAQFSDVYARVIEDQLISYLPQTPVPGALVSLGLTDQKSMMGVRGQVFTFTDNKGNFELFGATRERDRWIPCWAFQIDSKDGSIESITNLANNLGNPYSVSGKPRSWTERALSANPLSGTRRSARNTDQRLPLFRCSSLMIFDLLDQLYFSTLKELRILEASTNSSPKYFAQFMGRSWGSSYSEPCAVAFAEPETNVKLILSAGLLGSKFTLLNTDETNEKYFEGRGFMFREREQTIPFSPYQAARDMWILDNSRMEKLRQTGIRNKQVSDLHHLAKQKLDAAEEKRRSGNYDEFLNLAREAWALEGRAYPDVQKTANDVIKGVIFYFAILLPFAFFAERLFFTFADIRKQLVGIAAFFMAIYVVLRFVHPAFLISKTPIIILDGFFTLAMGGIVTVIVLNKFNVQMAKIREKTAAIHGTDVARGSAAMTAFILGISNMRRRKMRTALTCVTLVLLTFTVMSFTSFDTGLKFNKILTSYDASYQGILLRRRDWGPMEEHAYYSIADYFKTNPGMVIALRTWKTAPRVGDSLSLEVTRAEDPSKKFSAHALVGLGPSEAGITRPQLLAGRWFSEEENKGQFVCILPKRMAEFLGINQDNFEPGREAVRVSGDEYRVVGILDGGTFYETRDLDNEPLTPVDFIEMQSRRDQADQARAQPGQDSAKSEEALPELYIHMEGDNVLLIPAGLSIQLGASIQSIAIKMEEKSSKDIDQLLENYVRRLKLILFAGFKDSGDSRGKGRVVLYSSRGSISVQGLKGLLVPIIIAALIVFNTMLGSVYERTREIGIYAAVGLAPVHISALFLAESCVYATMGSILGYLLGQGVAKLIVTFDIWKDLSVNYSSTSAVVTTLVVVATVMLSTLFPAKKAAEISVPDETRKLRLPKPVGDEWVFDFPFTVSKAEAVALNMFLYDYFKAHDEDSIGRFCADQTQLAAAEEKEQPIYNLSSLVWIAPLDMGISQRVRIETREAPDDEKVDVLRFHIHRESGEVDTWRRMNTGFFKDLRKQLLIWRLVEASYKRELTLRGFELIGQKAPPEVLEAHQKALEAEEARRRRESEALAQVNAPKPAS